jgi:N-methylhydantoinase B
MTNSLNTPVEALEHAYPYHVRRYEIRRGSGGAGRFRGGDGIRREIAILAPAEITVLSDRRRYSPYGLKGGSPGKTGRNVVMTLGADGKDLEEEIPGKASMHIEAGTVISINTPGGGGYGTPEND